LPTEWKCVDRERELLTQRRTEVHLGQRLRQRIDAGIFLQLRVRRKDHFHGAIDRSNELFEATPTGGLNLAGKRPVPEVTPVPSRFQRPPHPNGPDERDTETFKERIVGVQLAFGRDRSPPKVADIYLQHSP